MDNQLFRKKSMERISSPEELHDYMRVTSPRLWMILSAIVILLAGFIVYASTTTLENTMSIKVLLESYDASEDSKKEGGAEKLTFVSSNLPLSQKDRISTGMEVRLMNERGRISWLSVSEEDSTVFVAMEMEHEYIPMPDGEYDATLVLESTTPISFLWN